MKIHLATALAATVLATSAMAQLPYQGRLTDNTGAPINPPSGTKSIRFALYGTATGGTPLWGPQDIVVNIVDGRFATKLGVNGAGGNITSALQAGGTYLQMTVDTVNLTRQEILPTPTAIYADTSETSEQIITSDVKLTTVGSSDTGSFGNSVNFTMPSTGLLLETSRGGDAGGLFIEDDGAVLFSTGSNSFLRVFDEDDMASGVTPISKFTINSAGGISTVSNITATGSLNIDGFSNLDGFSSVGNSSVTGTMTVSSTIDANGNLDVDGFTNLDGFTSDGVAVINSELQLNRSGSFWGQIITCTQTSTAQTFPLSLRARTPGFSHDWDFKIDSNDPTDADLLLIYNGVGSAVCEPNSNGWRAWSDASLKENVEELSDCLNAVMQLKPSKYNYKAATNGRDSYGFLAQEVQAVLPERVKKVNGKLTINYGEFGVLAVGAVKELKAELDAEKAKNAALEARLQAIEESLGL